MKRTNGERKKESLQIFADKHSCSTYFSSEQDELNNETNWKDVDDNIKKQRKEKNECNTH